MKWCCVNEHQELEQDTANNLLLHAHDLSLKHYEFLLK